MSLCFGYLESRKFPDFLFKTLQHKVSIGYVFDTYGVGYSVACSDKKGDARA